MSTVLHLPFDFESGAGGFIDHSPRRMAFAHVDSPSYYIKVDSDVYKYGNASLHVYGGYLVAPYDSAWMDLQGDWTVEMWLNTPLNNGSYMALLGRWPDSNGPWRFSITSGGRPYLDWVDASGTTDPASPDSTPAVVVAANVWTHVAFVRSGTTMSVYVGGALSYTQTVATIKTNALALINIGRSEQSNTWYYPGYIDDLRISDVALYTAAFTPPGKIDYTAITMLAAIPMKGAVEQQYYVSPSGAISRAAKFSRMIGRLSDYYYGGTGTIEGHTYVTSGSTKTAVSRRVRLLVQPHLGAIAETWSDSSGYYSFPRLSTDYKYTVVSFDHTGANESVVGSNITPV